MAAYTDSKITFWQLISCYSFVNNIYYSPYFEEYAIFSCCFVEASPRKGGEWVYF